MTTEKYIGMNRETGKVLTGLEHLQQSIRDILVTPIGSRVMCRKYGSLLSALIDQPQNAALRLQIMSACYVAIIQWEPRVRLTGIIYESDFNGGMVESNDDFRARIAAAFEGLSVAGPTGAYEYKDAGKAAEALSNLGLSLLGDGSAMLVGVPVPWPTATAPTGWIKCNRASFSAATYPELAKAYPALKLSDLRGEFLRGWDDGRTGGDRMGAAGRCQ